MSNSELLRSKVVGIACAVAALIIGAGWHVTTRLGVTTTLHPFDLALLRYGIPAILMSPVLFSVGLMPKSAPRGWLALVVIGAGLPFGLLAMAGSVYAPVAHMGVIIPGGITLGVAFLTWKFGGEKFSKVRLIGIGLLAIAFVSLGLSTISDLSSRTLLGDGMFLAGAAIWAGYTIAFRKCGLTPLQATAVISAWSLIVVLPLWIATPEVKLFQAPIWDVGIQFIWQSIFAGIVAVWAYGTAVKTIGPANTAAITALLPAISSLGGFIILNEPISILTGVSIALAVLGVILSTGYLESRAK